MKAAAKRQAKGLKRIPSKAYAAIKDIALESPDYKKALDVMADLGVTDVMAEIMKGDKQFRTSLVRYAEKKGIAYLFDLMDVGIPVGASMDFLTAPQQKRLREITAPMNREEAMAFLNALRNPGKAYRDGRFIPSLAQERGIAKKQMRSFMPEVNEVAREIILKEPTLVDDPNALKGAVRSRVIKASEALPGGKARDKKPSDFDAGELAAGIKVEHEHLVGDGYSKQEADDIAREIAMDHLSEIPDYYTRLDKMESEAGVKHATQRVVLRWLATR